MLREVGLPNCYTLTKHMAECLLADAHSAGRMRVAIVRPSVIGCLAYSPLPGYFGNAAGVTSATLAFASGPTFHSFCAHCRAVKLSCRAVQCRAVQCSHWLAPHSC